MSEEAIVALALQQPDPAARAAFLAAACGQDAALRRRVEAVLAREIAVTVDFTPDRQEGRSLPEQTGAGGADEEKEAKLDAGDHAEALEGHHDATEELTAPTHQEVSARQADDLGATSDHPRERSPELSNSLLGEGESLAGGEDVLAFLAPAQEAGSLGRLDDFEVLEVVGRGGMGLVLKARDTR